MANTVHHLLRLLHGGRQLKYLLLFQSAESQCPHISFQCNAVNKCNLLYLEKMLESIVHCVSTNIRPVLTVVLK